MKRLLLRLALPALVIVGLVNAAPAYGALTADSKLDPRLRAELKDGAFAYSVKVDLDFQPEYFHIRKLQQIGTVAGVGTRSVRVLQLTPAEVRQIAAYHWVRRLEPLDGGGQA